MARSNLEWAELPTRTESGPPALRSVWLVAVPAAVALAHVARLHGLWPEAVLASAAVAAIAAAGSTRPRTAATAVAAVAVVLSPLEPGTPLILIATAWMWGELRSGVDPQPEVLRGVAGPLVGSGLVLALGSHVGPAVVLLCVAVGALVAERQWPGSLAGPSRVIQRAARTIGALVGRVAMAPAAAAMILLWAVRSLAGNDPFASRRRGWLGRHGRDAAPERLYSSAAMEPKSLGRAHPLRRLGTGVIVTGIAGAVLWGALWVRMPGTPESEAFGDEPEFAAVWRDQQGFSRHVRFDPAAIYRYADYKSEHVNQVDGVRRTWTPPDCQCRRVRVWWFGGSAAWGFFQSDMDSLPSEVAKAAWKAGLALDIENRAQPGYTLSQEAQKFAQLSAYEPAPDLVVFYDGANELDFQIERNNAGRGTDGSPVSFYDPVIERALGLFDVVAGIPPSMATGQPLETEADDRFVDAPDLAEVAADRYRRGVELAKRLAASVGSQAVFVWQPTQTTAPEAAYAPFEPYDPWREEDLRWFDKLVGTARSLLPDDTIDLSDVLDGAVDPLMPDWAHTNVAGARTVAEPLAEHLVHVVSQEGG